MTISRIAVIGAGTMGSGIAQVLATHEIEVRMIDASSAALEKAQATIAKSLDRLIKKDKIAEADKDAIVGRLHPGADLKGAADCGMVIEAIVEDAATKKEVFRELDRITADDVILASNTSSISITELAAATGRPDRFIGMHFMNPVPIMPLVEVIRGLETSDETAAATVGLAERLGKSPVEVNDYPGFISNRLLIPFLNEAIQCVMEGVAEPEAIDQVMKLGMNHPMGPLTLADFIGLDVVLAIMEVLYEGFRDPKFRPSPLLVRMVKAGRLGRKSGRGFYEY